MRARAALLFILAPAMLSAVGGETQTSAPKLAPQSIVLRTAAGDIVMRLYSEIAPLHTEQFLKLARMHVFDGTHFYRVDPGFLIQSGVAEDRKNPLSPEQQSAIKPIKAEWSSLKHRRGVLNLGRMDNDPDSGTTAYCILLGDAPHLDGKYTIFGQVDERSLEVVEQIARVPCTGTVPKERMTIDEAIVLENEDALKSFHRAPVRNIADEIRFAQTKLPIPTPIFRLVALLTVAGMTGFLLGTRASNKSVTACVLAQAGLAVWVMLAIQQERTAYDTSVALLEQMPAAGAVFGLMIAVVVISVIAVASAKWLSMRVRMSLNLLNVLLGAFALVTVTTPIAQISAAAGVGIFIGLVSVIKLMGSFESFN